MSPNTKEAVGVAEEAHIIAYTPNGPRGDKELPEYQADSTLQKFVKLLKRHRDVRYAVDEDKPISIIIFEVPNNSTSLARNHVLLLKNLWLWDGSDLRRGIMRPMENYETWRRKCGGTGRGIMRPGRTHDRRKFCVF
jgi:hypothetical protein